MWNQNVSSDVSLRWKTLWQTLRTRLPQGPQAEAYTLAGGAIILWASWPSLASIAQPAPPFLLLSVAALSGFLGSASAAWARGNVVGWISIPWPTALIVLAGLLGNNAFYLAAIARIGPAEANIVHYLWPVLMVGLAAVVLGKRPTLTQVAGVLTGFAGVAIALSPQIGGGGLDAAGLILGICGALTFATYSIVRSKATFTGDVVGPSMGLIAICAGGAHLLFEGTFEPSMAQWGAMVAIGLGPFTMSNVLWDRATRKGSAAAIASFAFLTPLVAITLLSALGLASISAPIIAGAGLAIAGAVLTSKAG